MFPVIATLNLDFLAVADVNQRWGCCFATFHTAALRSGMTRARASEINCCSATTAPPVGQNDGLRVHGIATDRAKAEHLRFLVSSQRVAILSGHSESLRSNDSWPKSAWTKEKVRQRSGQTRPEGTMMFAHARQAGR